MNQETKCPNINLWSISLLSEYLRWHKNRSTNNFFINLFFDCKTKVSQFVQNTISLLFQKYIVWLDISMNDIIFRNEFNTTSKLIHNLHTLRFWYRTFFIDDLLQISIWTELQNHRNIIFSQEAIINFSGEHSIWIITKSKLSEHTNLSIYNRKHKLLIISLIFAPYFLIRFNGNILTAITFWVFVIIPL